MKKIIVKCKCGEPISTSDAAKALRAGRKREMTSDEAKIIRAKRKKK